MSMDELRDVIVQNCPRTGDTCPRVRACTGIECWYPHGEMPPDGLTIEEAPPEPST